MENLTFTCAACNVMIKNIVRLGLKSKDVIENPHPLYNGNFMKKTMLEVYFRNKEDHFHVVEQ